MKVHHTTAHTIRYVPISFAVPKNKYNNTMGNDYSSPRDRDRDEYGDGESTVMSGTSGWSYDTRETKERLRKSVGSSGGRTSKRDGGDEFPYASNLIDSLCGRIIFEDDKDDGYKKKDKDRDKRRSRGRDSGGRSHSDDYSDDDTYDSGTVTDDRKEKSGSGRKSKKSSSRDIDSPVFSSYDENDDDSRMKDPHSRSRSTSLEKDDDTYTSPDNSTMNMKPTHSASFDSNSHSLENNHVDYSNTVSPASATTGISVSQPVSHGKPLASAFAKRCYFTKAGIGPMTQHYEGNTLSGNTVLMLASAMKLKGCPTICDEDLRRVEQTYPNQFSRLPDELLLSSGWRRISKYCHFSGKPIPDGVPFFHSKERIHPQTGGYYFLLASSLGMERIVDVEPLTIDMLILLQTDFPTQCDQAPRMLLEDPGQWTLVTKFCFFSGGPINDVEDVYYEAEFDGKAIYMLAFLSPNLTPEELYRLNDITGENALKSVAAVEEVDQVYNLTERDFDDLKLYHLGPCRALPEFVISPKSWKKVLPVSFIECREKALARAYEFETHAQEAIAKAGKLMGNVNGGIGVGVSSMPMAMTPTQGSGSHQQSIPGSPPVQNGSSGHEYVEFNKSQPESSPGFGVDVGQNVAQNPSFSPPAESRVGSLAESPEKMNGHQHHENDEHGQLDDSMDTSGYTDDQDQSFDAGTQNEEHFTEEAGSYMEEGVEDGRSQSKDESFDHPEDEFPPGQSSTSPSPQRRLEDVPDPDAPLPYDTSEEFPQEEPDFAPMMDPAIPPNLHRSTRNEQEEGAFGGAVDIEDPSIGGEPMISPVSNNEDVDGSQYQSIGKGSEELDGDRSVQSNVTPSIGSPDRISIRDGSPLSRKSERDPSPEISRSPRQVSFREEASSKSGSAAPSLTVDTEPSRGIIDVPDPSPRLDFVSPLSTPGHFNDFGESSVHEPSTTPQSQQSEYSRSSAMRGAQELLKKNRQQRLAIMAKRRSAREDVANSNTKSENNGVVYSHSRNRSITPSQRNKSPSKRSLSPTKKPNNPPPPSPSGPKTHSPLKMSLYRSPSASTRSTRRSLPGSTSRTNVMGRSPSPSFGLLDDSDVKSEATSAVSAASSVWTDTTDLSEKDQRRALILKMAKNRMKSKKDALA